MKKTIRLIWQLYPTYLLITLLALGAASWYASSFLSDYFLERTIAGLKTQGRIVMGRIEPHLFPLNAGEVDRLCKEIGNSAQIRVTVILPNGRVVGDSDENPTAMDNHADRPEFLKAVSGQAGSALRYSRTLDKRMMYVALPLRSPERLEAILRVSIPLTEVDKELSSIQERITFGGFLIALFAAVVCFYVSRRISRPIEEMRKGAEYFATGDLKYRLSLTDITETANLAEAMNLMAARLESRIEAEVNQRNQIEAVLSSMSEGVIALDMDEHILSFNQAAATMFVRLSASVKNQSLHEIIRNRNLQQFVERAQKSNIPVKEDIILNQNGERIIDINASFLRDAIEKRIGTLLVLNDVTQLRRLEKMRQDFVANVSHEIKTPLTAIKGFVETLQSGTKDNSKEAARFLSIIDKNVNRLGAIVDDLLQLSRIEKENEEKLIKLTKTVVKKIITSSIKICKAEAEAKQIEINFTCDDSLEAMIEP
ncbi:MAG: histidine kinase dimerization/phospho-acceptor domain-containing protein, partial [Thermodesulfobacteriota bacterium]|nr:histidine kinase dimerization/phospho-acceptor domain-containing protein [Thermodesulfobacteriota bacterium]